MTLYMQQQKQLAFPVLPTNFLADYFVDALQVFTAYIFFYCTCADGLTATIQTNFE